MVPNGAFKYCKGNGIAQYILNVKQLHFATPQTSRFLLLFLITQFSWDMCSIRCYNSTFFIYFIYLFIYLNFRLYPLRGHPPQHHPKLCWVTEFTVRDFGNARPLHFMGIDLKRPSWCHH